MKKLLLTTAVIISLASCEREIQIKEYRTKKDYPFSSISHFEHKGHDYILFDTGYGEWAVGGVVHDPDCKCKTKDKEEQP